VVLVLFQEIKAVLADSYVNDRHIMSVVRTMCFRGYLMPNTRHGINRIDTGVFMKVSFEESMDHLTNAALFAEKDDLKGVTENMMVGALAPMGTAMVTCEVKPEYQSLMDKVRYDRLIVEETQQKIFRSMITEWNDQYDVQQDDMDDIDRPPSPPGKLSSEQEHGTSVLPHHINWKQQATIPYRPSTPDISDNLNLNLDDAQKQAIHEQFIYRPSSPDIDALASSDTIANFIPLHSIESDDIFQAPRSSLLPDEPASETVASEPLLSTEDGENLTSLLDSLSHYFQ